VTERRGGGRVSAVALGVERGRRVVIMEQIVGRIYRIGMVEIVVVNVRIHMVVGNRVSRVNKRMIEVRVGIKAVLGLRIGGMKVEGHNTGIEQNVSWQQR